MRVGLDVDGVLADFNQGLFTRAETLGLRHHFPATSEEVYRWDYGVSKEVFSKCFEGIKYCPKFWAELSPMPDLVLPLPFEVCGYVTNRFVDSWLTEAWLESHGLPDAPVYTVDNPLDKLHALRELDVDCFVDDRAETVAHLNDEGVLTYVLDRPWNRSLDSRYPRIYSLQELGAEEIF